MAHVGRDHFRIAPAWLAIIALAGSLALTPLPSTASAAPPAAALRPAAASLTPGTWGWQNPIPSGDLLLSISCPITTVCYTAGNAGLVLTTLDAGAHWTVLNAGETNNIEGISCANAVTCVAVDDLGYSFTTVNAGVDWTRVSVNSGKPLYGVSCAEGKTVCFATGPGGKVYGTVDVGTTWSPQPSVVTAALFAISCANRLVCTAVGAGGAMETTVDGGATWLLDDSKVTANLFAAYCPPVQVPFGYVCFAAGDGGVVDGTNDMGATWVPSTVGSGPNPLTLTGIVCNGSCMVTATDGFIYEQPTSDWTAIATSATAWNVAGTGANGSLWSIACPSLTAQNTSIANTTCLAVGDFGTVLITTNHGSGWSTARRDLMEATPTLPARARRSAWRSAPPA